MTPDRREVRDAAPPRPRKPPTYDLALAYGLRLTIEQQQREPNLSVRWPSLREGSSK